MAQNWQLALAKHSSSSNEDNNKESSKSNNDQPKEESNAPVSGPTADSTTDAPTVGPITIPPIASDTTTTTACKESNDPECIAATNNLIKQGIELEKQKIALAQQQQEQNTIALENQRVIDNLNQQSQISDTSSGSSSNGGSRSSDSTSEKNISQENQDKNLGAESRFIIAQTDDNKVGLYKIQSDEKAMNVYELHNLIRPIEEFSTAAEALTAVMELEK